MADSLQSRIEALERNDARNTQLIADMERENTKLKQRVTLLETSLIKVKDLRVRKDKCVFSARLSLDSSVNGLPLIVNGQQSQWKHINKCDLVYKASPSFDANDCIFKAPNRGDYFMDLGVRQKSRGALEVMLILHHRVGRETEVKHAYIGMTTSEGGTCHKSMVVSLDVEDTVHGVVRCVRGNATINWCAFHGYMITDTSADVR